MSRVVGDGDIGSILTGIERPGFTFFASGVSNSKEDRVKEFKREVDLLSLQPRTTHLVYFSSLAIFYSDTPYTRHKRKMEAVIQVGFPKHTIIRLGNITWGSNPHTLINYLKAHPEAEIRDEYRYIIDKQEFLHWIGLIPEWSCEMNLPGRMMKVKEVVNEYVRPHIT